MISMLGYLITSLCFLIWTVRNILFWVALWQRREYRLDRIMAELFETQQGKSLLTSKIALIKWLLIPAFAFVIYDGNILPFYHIAVFVVFVIEALKTIREFFSHRLQRPIFTVKALLLAALTIYIYFAIFIIPIVDRYAWLILLDRLLPFFIAFLVFLFTLPTVLYKDYKIEKARNRLAQRDDITVIGITGSYGKSSTKEYIAQVLSSSFDVLKTEQSNNTPIGVANSILSGLKKSTQIFVVEMGAYKRGEISALCAIAPPTIGVLTAIAPQHLSLFGSLENIRKAKYEIIEAVPQNGLAIFNGNNSEVYNLYKQTKKKKALYTATTKGAITVKGDLHAFNIQTKKFEVTFDVSLKSKKIHFQAPLIGAHTVENVLPAIYIADYLKIPEKTIKDAVANLVPLTHTMSVHELSNDGYLIDNTFNSNPDGIIALLEYMKLYKGKKIVVLEPMIELGKQASFEHQRVGKAASKMCDILFLTKKTNFSDIEKGIKEGKGNCTVKLATPFEVSDFIMESMGSDDVVALIGKEQKSILAKTRRMFIA